jgi:hypothetical protein
MIADTNADVTAWATVAAVVLALLGSVGTGLWKWLRRPRIEITFGNTEPLMTFEPSATNPEWQYIRAKVRNKGHRGAGNVRAQITRVWFKADNQPRADGRSWPELIRLTIPLPWTSRSFQGSDSTEHVDLPPGLVDYLDISRKSMIQNMETYDHLLCGLGNEPKRQDLHDRMMKIGEYRIEVAVFSDDTKPKTKLVSYKQSPDLLPLHEIQPSQRPPKEKNLTPPSNFAEVPKRTQTPELR